MGKRGAAGQEMERESSDRHKQEEAPMTNRTERLKTDGERPGVSR